jgi:hypothetical protein
MVWKYIETSPLQDVNYEEDWKLVTLWIGGNDLCAVCKGEVRSYLISAAISLSQQLTKIIILLTKIIKNYY